MFCGISGLPGRAGRPALPPERSFCVSPFVFVLAGLVILIATPLLGDAMHPFLLTVVSGAALVPVVYSYVDYRRLTGDRHKGESNQ